MITISKHLFLVLLVSGSFWGLAGNPAITFSLDTVTDTLKVIELQPVEGEKIKYLAHQKEIIFSKDKTTKVLDQFISDWESVLTAPESDTTADWKRKKLIHYKKIREYIAQTDSLVLSNAWKAEEADNKVEMEDGINLYASYRFYDLACQLLETGEVSLIVRGNPVKTILKTRKTIFLEKSKESSIKFVLPAGQEIWTCPPIIRADY